VIDKSRIIWKEAVVGCFTDTPALDEISKYAFSELRKFKNVKKMKKFYV
jgi:hypothetical protein